MMSSTLDMKGKERYKEKLKLVGFLTSDNPYSPSHTEKFHSDVPVAEDRIWTHICLHYLQTRDFHSRTITLMKAVRRIQNGHVRIVLSMIFSSGKIKGGEM